MEESSSGPGVAGVHRPKDPRMKAKYNVLSRLLLCWADPLFWIGCCRSLEQTDLYVHPSEADSEKLLRTFNRHWNVELERKRRGLSTRLYLVILKCFWLRLLVASVAMVIHPICAIGQSILVGYLADYFTIQNPTSQDTRDAYLYGLGIVLFALVLSISINQSFLLTYKLGMHCRIMLSAAIYQKVLSLSQVTIGRLSIGHVVNLASNDVHRLDMVFIYIQSTWIAPVVLVVVTYFVYVELGWSAFLVTGYYLLTMPVLILFGRCFAYLRLKTTKITDKRIRIMNEIISGIRVVKMYAWDHAFKKLIESLRRKESFLILEGGVIRACGLGSVNTAITVAMYLVFSVFTATGGELSPRKVFVTLSLLIVLRLVAVQWGVHNVLNTFEGWVALVRLRKFFELEELDPVKEIEGKEVAEKEGVEDSCVDVTAMSASWSNDRENMVLRDVTFKVDKGNPLLAVVGQVGAGKSSLLQCILGELKPLEGGVVVRGKLSYASQEVWVFSATLRENILFGQPFKPAWYNRVIEACALDKDIESLVNGDLTLVGERGVTLSGGQKARVNLARAIYRDADIFLLDDPLSAVDAPVARHIFERCICGLLKDRIVILVTHQVQFALQADKILVLKEGHTEVHGSCSEMVAMGINPTELLGLITHKEGEEEKDQFLIKEDDPVPDGEELEDSKADRLAGPYQLYAAPSMTSLKSQLEDAGSPEPSMISAERVMDYCKLEPEAPLETVPPSNKPPPDWPSNGKITMDNVSFQYSPDLPLVLNNLCFSIEPSEKIGIVGRTGAGKSSLISVLYRLGEPRGVIWIDDVDSKTIGLHCLRKKMSIIPQDPVLFSGTMRYNLDPFDEYSDIELWEALEQVQLRSAVQQLEGQLGGEVSEGGSNFSVGQRQLVCLARALLRKNKILVLDEATANVDLKTDEIIQQTIRENFSNCTVVTIAHRLNTIMDSDRILVMSKGRVKELDNPYNLLQNPDSLFTKMVEKTGPSASKKLRQMAVDGHLNRTALAKSKQS